MKLGGTVDFIESQKINFQISTKEKLNFHLIKLFITSLSNFSNASKLENCVDWVARGVRKNRKHSHYVQTTEKYANFIFYLPFPIIQIEGKVRKNPKKLRNFPEYDFNFFYRCWCIWWNQVWVWKTNNNNRKFVIIVGWLTKIRRVERKRK